MEIREVVGAEEVKRLVGLMGLRDFDGFRDQVEGTELLVRRTGRVLRKLLLLVVLMIVVVKSREVFTKEGEALRGISGGWLILGNGEIIERQWI